ncbi:MAG: Bax inhibitor-1 family protein [Proteobacteria bacterium]|nr:Bax inhibitor-1 family protein [Pseudomonadota bacterium]
MNTNYQTPVIVNPLLASRVLRNTYALLGLLFVASSVAAWFSQAMHWHIGFFPMLAGLFGFSFLIAKTRNSAWGIVAGFGFSAFLGLITGGNIDYMLARYSNGGELVVMAFGMTAIAFFGISAYAMVAKRDFSNMIAMLGIGTLVVIVGFIANYFLHIPALGLALSSLAVMLSMGWMLWQTQRIVNGGETNYIIAATGLLADIFVLFNNLLALIGFGFGDD